MFADESGDKGPRPGGGLLAPGRLEAFSDGVFAIAITLLVLELEVPTAPDDLLAALAEEWPSYLGYLVSFAFIGSVWVAHSTLTKFVSAVDQVLMGLNLVLLFMVSVLPFTTKLMASHLGDAGEHAAVVIFGINLTLASLTLNAIFSYAARTKGLADAAADEELVAFARRRRISVIVMALATALGLVLPEVAVVAYLAVSLLFLVLPVVRARRGFTR